MLWGWYVVSIEIVKIDLIEILQSPKIYSVDRLLRQSFRLDPKNTHACVVFG
jgi:hypothetical protein